MEELRALVVGLVEANAGVREVIAANDHQIASLKRRLAELERQLGADSSTSNRPPSSVFAVSQTCEAVLAHLLGAPAREAARGSGVDDAAGGRPALRARPAALRRRDRRVHNGVTSALPARSPPGEPEAGERRWWREDRTNTADAAHELEHA
jgi:hypothetical protein